MLKKLLELYIAFLRIGAVNFGGGYAMLPLLDRDLAQDRGWVTTEELMDYFAIGQCTPGIIALNVSTFIGNKQAGILGGVIATLGFLTAPIAIILAISASLRNFAEYPVVQNAFAGIRVCVCVLIVQAVLRLWKKSVVDGFTLLLYLVIFVLNAFSGVLPVKIPAAVLVICAGVIGVLASMLKRKEMAAAENKRNAKESSAAAGPDSGEEADQ